jgi:hypothetical protein
MARLLYLAVLAGGSFVAAQVAPIPSPDPAQPPAGVEGLSPTGELSGKTTLVRGVVKRVDPVHDQLLIHVFGGGVLRVAFDTRTELVHDNARTQLNNIPSGSVVSVDTVMDHGKLFARTVRLAAPSVGELSCQVVHYDAAKSQLMVRDAASSENIALRVTSNTTVINRGQPSSPQALSPGMLVRVKFAQSTASNVEILAERGSTFSFTGRVVAVDLRTRVVALSNASDQSIRELAISTLDPTSMRLLREGADVSIQADFDGDRYNARSVTLLSQNP